MAQSTVAAHAGASLDSHTYARDLREAAERDALNARALTLATARAAQTGRPVEDCLGVLRTAYFQQGPDVLDEAERIIVEHDELVAVAAVEGPPEPFEVPRGAQPQILLSAGRGRGTSWEDCRIEPGFARLVEGVWVIPPAAFRQRLDEGTARLIGDGTRRRVGHLDDDRPSAPLTASDRSGSPARR